ncbi:MAG: hypothetical protein R2795_02350 [Saprospiraceae bacterium]
MASAAGGSFIWVAEYASYWIANSKWEIYTGGENLTNVVQENAIIGAWEPFDGAYFDASQVYQPLFRSTFYLGLRYVLFKNHKLLLF